MKVLTLSKSRSCLAIEFNIYEMLPEAAPVCDSHRSHDFDLKEIFSLGDWY